MITDFSEYTNTGLQNITYHGINSLADLGIVLAEGTRTGDLTANSITETIPYRNGQIDMSVGDNGLTYESRVLVYRFKVFANDIQELREKEARIKTWLNSNGNHKIYDSDYSNLAFEKCVLKSIETENGEKGGIAYMYLTATFEAEPFMLVSGDNTRIVRVARTGSVTLTVASNSAVTIEGTTTQYSVNEPYTYRIIAYTEGTPTITLNGTAIEPDTLFEMPANAEIIITNTGYGYYELWHDTREVTL